MQEHALAVWRTSRSLVVRTLEDLRTGLSSPLVQTVKPKNALIELHVVAIHPLQRPRLPRSARPGMLDVCMPVVFLLFVVSVPSQLQESALLELPAEVVLRIPFRGVPG